MHHREKPGGIWSKLGKEKRPQDPIYRLKVPRSNLPQFKRQTKRMAKITCNYHENLQNEGLNLADDRLDHKNKTTAFLQEIPREQTIQDQETTAMNQLVRKEYVKSTILQAKNGSAIEIDECPYKLWKRLVNEHENRTKENILSFNITHVLTTVL
jgi:hypothetical protein